MIGRRRAQRRAQKMHGGDVVRVRRRMRAQRGSRVPRVPEEKAGEHGTGSCHRPITDQQWIRASSFCRTVPAATSMPSCDTSQESSAEGLPAGLTGKGSEHLLSCQNAGGRHTRGADSLWRGVERVRSSQTLTDASLPEETRTRRLVPATESTARRWVIPPS